MIRSLRDLLATGWTPVLRAGAVWWCTDCGAGGWWGRACVRHRPGCPCAS